MKSFNSAALYVNRISLSLFMVLILVFAARPAQAAPKERLNMLADFGGDTIDAVSALLKSYASFVDVNFVQVGDNAFAKIPLLRDEGVPVHVGIFTFEQAAQLAREGALEPLDGYMMGSAPFSKDNIWPQAWDAVTVDGKIYGMPVHVTTYALIYNKKIFTELGIAPPKTWDEFAAAAKKLATPKKPDGNRDRWGAFVRDKFETWLSIYTAKRPGALVDASGKKVLFDNQDAVDALRFLVDLHTGDNAAPLTEPFGRRLSLDQAPIQILLDENIELVKNDPAGAAQLPNSNLQGMALVVFKDATPRQKQAAWKLLRVFAGSNVQGLISQSTGWLTVNRKVAGKPDFKASLSSRPLLETYYAELPGAQPFPAANGRGARIAEILRAAVMDALWGAATPEQAIADAAKKAQSVLDAPEASAVDTRDDISPFGMGIYFGNRYDPVDFDRVGALARDAGIKWSREEYTWSLIEPEEGKFQWERYDRAIDAASRYGVHLFGLFDYTVPWSSGAIAPRNDAQRADFANYVFQTVSHFKGRVKYWEVWNEPNIDVFWWPHVNVADYVALLRETYLSVKRADPTAVVMLGGCSGSDLAWMDAIYKNGGGDYFDVLGFHPYADKSALDDGRYEYNLKYIRALMAHYGVVKPGWITEVGWPTTQGGITHEEQAAAYAKMVAHSLGSGYVVRIVPYDFRDDADDPGYGEANFGVLRRDFSPKTSYTTYSFLSAHLANYTSARRDDPCAACIGYSFATPGGSFRILWHPRKGQSAKISLAPKKETTVFDVAGKEIQKVAAGQTAEVVVSNTPVFVLEKKIE